MIKDFLKKIVPGFAFSFYYRVLALSAALFYGFPSREMVVIGVTGTKGKSTTVNLIADILKQAGLKTGCATTYNFRIDDQEWENKTKMTMLGRFALQRLLKKMLKAGCSYAVIETSSQGVAQYRHLGINYDIGVFTNLSPEHIEAHGSFDKYREAKQEFFRHLSISKKKMIDGRLIKKISVVNLDDSYKEYFLGFQTDKQYGYTLGDGDFRDMEVILAENVSSGFQGSEFVIRGTSFRVGLLGKFNVSNSMAAISVALSQGISLNACRRALNGVRQVPGRMEVVSQDPFVLVDYAHTPDSLEKVYQNVSDFKNGRMICVLGAAGGGRDKWKRPVMGALAEKYCDEIIVTNEDPYDENPEEIINQIISGIRDKKTERIVDRRKAINQALIMAEKGDMVIITGKGCEAWIMGPKGKRFPWDDREAVRECLNNR